jgi:hypothetical protein
MTLMGDYRSGAQRFATCLVDDSKEYVQSREGVS